MTIGFAVAFPVATQAAGDEYLPAEPSMTITSDDYGTAIVEEVIREEPSEIGGFPTLQQIVRMRLLDGSYRGEQFDLKNGILREQEREKLLPGQRVVIERMVRSDGTVLHLNRGPYRLPSMGWIAVLFLTLSVVFGGLYGLTSVFGLVVSVSILFLFVIPRITDGSNPLLVSIIGSYFIACTSLYLAHGFNRRTSVALLSTAITLGLSAITAVMAVRFTHLFGMGSEESMYLATGQFSGIDLRGLLIGGFIIGALGVLDDVTTAQCAAVEEISKANPSLSEGDLWRAGMSVGREHIASLINTLALAYVGASLPLFLLFRSNDHLPTWLVLNGEFIAEEVVRTLVGSTALLLAVPISTWCAAKLLKNRTGHVLPSGDGHHHHHH